MIDLHIHSNLSDGSLSLKEIIEKCAEKAITAIGITDHWKTRRYDKCQCVTDIKKHIEVCNSLHDFALYYGITVKIGLEIDFSKQYGVDIPESIIKEMDMFDYLLFEYVDTESESWGSVCGNSIYDLVDITKCVSIPVGLANNDFQKNYKENYQEIITLMCKNNIFLELCEGEPMGGKKINSSILKNLLSAKCNMPDLSVYHQNDPINRNKHMREDKYYFEWFTEDIWETIKQKGLKISIGTDSHNGTHVGNCTKVLSYIEKYDLYDAVIFGLGMHI